jgi:hypothetical protein
MADEGRPERKRPAEDDDAQREIEVKADEQYRKMGAEFVGTALLILSLCLRGQTVRAQQSDLDPDTAKHTGLCELLKRLDRKHGNKKNLS